MYGTKIKRIPNPTYKTLTDKEIQRLLKEATDPFTVLSRVKEIKQVLSEHYKEKGKLDETKQRVKRVSRI